jgi:SAM-dependent methyltransferase
MTDSTTWAERYAATAMVWDTTPNQFVVEACRKLPPGRALDLGAGEGRNAIWLAGRGWQVTAVDFASIAVGRISSRAALQNVAVNAIVDNALTYRPKPASLELILLSYLQLPLDQLRKVFTNVIPGLVSGGRLVIVAHDLTNLSAGYGGPQNPEVLASASEVGNVAATAGLHVQRAEVLRREVITDDGIRYAADQLIVAIRP